MQDRNRTFREIRELEREMKKRQSIAGYRMLGVLHNATGNFKQAAAAFRTAMAIARENEDEQQLHEIEELLDHIRTALVLALENEHEKHETQDLLSCISEEIVVGDPSVVQSSEEQGLLHLIHGLSNPGLTPSTDLAAVVVSDEDDITEPVFENLPRNWPHASIPVVKDIVLEE
jgi:hypothetical protein